MTNSELGDIRSALAQCFCTSAYHSYDLVFFEQKLLLTDGTLLMAKLCHAFWLVGVIYSYQHLKKMQAEGFQVWKLTLNQDGESGVIICTDGNDNILIEQKLDYTDFPLPEGITLWKEGDVLLLPSEH
jgi:hypothetical protein